jgi:hypothetical protein
MRGEGRRKGGGYNVRMGKGRAENICFLFLLLFLFFLSILLDFLPNFPPGFLSSLPFPLN